MNRREFLAVALAGTAAAGCASTRGTNVPWVPRANGGGDPRMRGPFPIASTPYHEDGSVDYEALARECLYVSRSGCPGVIWCQSNDAIDLLTLEEKKKGFEVLAKAMEGQPCMLTLGANGANDDAMVATAQAIEEVAKRHPKTNIAIISRPGDDTRTEADLKRYYEKLGEIARRPIIIQTACNSKTPTPSVPFIVSLAKKWPDRFGYIKEEAGGAKANERMKEENAAKPVIHTVFSAWGGWQWLFQSRQCGSEGLITERCAYAPLLAKIWRLMEAKDQTGEVDLAYALLRLLIDQRNFPGGLRGYSLYYLQKAGCFTNLVSREYEKSKQDDGGTRGEGKKWKLGTVSLSDDQKAELDALWDTMQAFCRR